MGGPSHPLFALLLGRLLISWGASDFTACCSGAGDNPSFLKGLLSTAGCVHTSCSWLPPSRLRGSSHCRWVGKAASGTPSMPASWFTVGKPLLCHPSQLPAWSVLALVWCLAWCHFPPPQPSHLNISNKNFLGNVPHLQEILAVKMNSICL